MVDGANDVCCSRTAPYYRLSPSVDDGDGGDDYEAMDHLRNAEKRNKSTRHYDIAGELDVA